MMLCMSWTQKKADRSLLKYRWAKVEHQFLGAKHLSKNGFTLVLLGCIKTISSLLLTSTGCAQGANSLLEVRGRDE